MRPQMVLEHNQRSTWTRLFSEVRDVPLGGCCGVTMELERREATIIMPLHLLCYANGIHKNLWF
jgi:hypothetical protein